MSVAMTVKSASPLKAAISQRQDAALVAGAHDVVSAILAEKAGFDGIWASSLAVATTIGHLDDDAYTMTDVLAATANITRVVNIPLLADVGAGWRPKGDVESIVAAFETAGAAGICMEDSAYPRRNSLYDEQRHLTPTTEFAERISRAVAAKGDPEFLVLARVESLIAGHGLEETLRRASAYESAGADAIVIHSTSPTHHQVQQVAECWQGTKPLALIPTKYPHLPISEFRRIPQVGMLIYANHSLRASMKATEMALQQIQLDGHAGGVEQWIAPVSDVLHLQTRFGEAE